MHFEVQHDFAASRADVAALLCDAGFHAQLDLPDLSRPEVVTNSADGATHVLRLRYEYVGQLDPIARKLLGDRKLTWIQEIRLDSSTYTGTLSFSADENADRLAGGATVAIDELDPPAGEPGARGGRSRRRIAGDLAVRVPVVGRTAERRIVPGLVRRLDVEAAAVARELSRTRVIPLEDGHIVAASA